MIPQLMTAVAKDRIGLALELNLPDGTGATPLYAHRAAVLPQPSWGHARHRQACRIAARLDQKVLRLLAECNRHRVFDTTCL